MNIDQEAAYIREQLEHRKITSKEARKMLDHLDTLAVCSALEKEGPFKPPRRIS
jgi:5-bromo-4-chloroindolyl phosphate hydrolysis protein